MPKGAMWRSNIAGQRASTTACRRSWPTQSRRNPSTPSPPIHTYQSSGFDRPGNVRAVALFSEYAQIATAILRHRNKVLSTRPSQLDHDRPCHAWVQGAEIFVSAGLREGKREAIVGIERLRLKQPGCRGDSVRYVVLVAPSYRRSRLHGEARRYEGKIIDFGGCVLRTHRAGKKDDRRQQTSDTGRDSRIA